MIFFIAAAATITIILIHSEGITDRFRVRPYASKSTSTIKCSALDPIKNITVPKECHACYFCPFTSGGTCFMQDFERCPDARNDSDTDNPKCYLLREFEVKANGERGTQTGVQKGCLHSISFKKLQMNFNYTCPTEQNPNPANLPNVTFECCSGMVCNNGAVEMTWGGFRLWKYLISSLLLFMSYCDG